MKKAKRFISNLNKYKGVNLEYDLESYFWILFVYKLFRKKAIIKWLFIILLERNLIDNEEINNIILKYYHYLESYLNALKMEINSMNFHYMHIFFYIKRKFKFMKIKYYNWNINSFDYNLFAIKREGRKIHTYDI